MPLGIYTPNVIILSLLSGLSILQPFTLPSFFVSSLSLPLLSHASSVAHWVQCCRCFQEDMSGVQGSETKGDAEIYILCVLVNIILACLLLMQCCSMHMVPGGAGHVWFIRCVPTHRPRAFMPAISIPEWRSLQSLTSSLADSGGDRQTPRYRSVSADGRRGDLTQSEPCTCAHWMEAHFCRVCTAL